MRNSAERLYERMREGGSLKEIAYLEGLYGLREKYVEAWVSNFKNLGIRSTQLAESMNNSFKIALESTQSPLVDLFHALKKMCKNHEERCEFMDFQLTDRPRTYSPLLSLLMGKVSRFMLDLLEAECFKARLLILSYTEDMRVVFSDSHELVGDGCNCPFFVQYSAPCAHMLKHAGESALDKLHQGWVINDATITEPSIMYGPRHTPQISDDERRQTEALNLIANLQVRLLDMPSHVSILFAKKFHEMLDRGNIDEPALIRDPPVSRPRGRPRRLGRNMFRGGRNI